MTVRSGGDIDTGIGWLSEFVGTGVSIVSSVLKWVFLLNVGIVWVAFWANLVRVHLAMGDTIAAIVTAVLTIGPLPIVALWLISPGDRSYLPR